MAMSASNPVPALVFGTVALLVGLLMLVLGGTNLRRELADQRRAVRLPGEVVGAEWRRIGAGGTDGSSLLSFPVVRYAEPTGTVRTFVADVGTSTVARNGRPMVVLHDPTGATAPQLAGLRSRAALPAGLLVGGALASSVGLGMLLR